MPTDTMMIEAIRSAAQKQDITGLKLNTCQQLISDNLLNKIIPKPSKRITIRKTAAVGITTMHVNRDIQAMQPLTIDKLKKIKDKMQEKAIKPVKVDNKEYYIITGVNHG